MVTTKGGDFISVSILVIPELLYKMHFIEIGETQYFI